VNGDKPTLVVVEVTVWDESYVEAVLDHLKHDRRVMSVEVISG
jgi:hypothetical protein